MSRVFKQQPSRQQQRGVGLIEVLVTVVLLSTSLLSIAVLQTRSLQQNHSAAVRTQANIVAYDLIDRVRAASNPPPTALAVLPAAAVTALIANTLPGGSGTLVCDAARFCTATINWSENNGMNADGVTSTFIYSASL